MEIDTLAIDLAFPEGPAFDPHGNLWFVEWEGGSVARVTEAGIERVECSSLQSSSPRWFRGYGVQPNFGRNAWNLTQQPNTSLKRPAVTRYV